MMVQIRRSVSCDEVEASSIAANNPHTPPQYSDQTVARLMVRSVTLEGRPE